MVEAEIIVESLQQKETKQEQDQQQQDHHRTETIIVGAIVNNNEQEKQQPQSDDSKEPQQSNTLQQQSDQKQSPIETAQLQTAEILCFPPQTTTTDPNIALFDQDVSASVKVDGANNFGNVMVLPEEGRHDGAHQNRQSYDATTGIHMFKGVANSQREGSDAPLNPSVDTDAARLKPMAQTQQQKMYKKSQRGSALGHPQQQKNSSQGGGMGIGPGGSDLSQFFTTQEKLHAAAQVKQTSGTRQVTVASGKPQTAGTFGSTLMMDASEFGAPVTGAGTVAQQESKQSSGFILQVPQFNGPNITNIGFDITQQPNIIAFPNVNNNRAQLQTQGQNRTTGSFTITTNDRSKSFHHSKQFKKGQVTCEYAVNSNIGGGILTQSGRGVGLKPYIQGSSLQRPGTQSRQAQTKQHDNPLQAVLSGASSSTKRQTSKPNSHYQFTDYNFFSQKLAQNGIPKNQEIKYRKEMQQLKFYQTLNNYPYLVEQQRIKEEQLAKKKAAAKQQAVMGSSSYCGSSNLGVGTMTNTAARTRVASQELNGGEVYKNCNRADMVSQRVDPIQIHAMTQVTNSYEMVNVRDSQANSTKQTVYQMKSSRTAIQDAQRESKKASAGNIAHTETLQHLNATSSGQIVLTDQLSSSIVADPTNTASGGAQYPGSHPMNKPNKNSKEFQVVAEHAAAQQASRNFMGSGGTPAPYENNQLPLGEAYASVAGNTHNKRSIITQETDLQISTFQASTMEQRAIFNTSPKLREIPAPPAGQATAAGRDGATAANANLRKLTLAGEPTTSEKFTDKIQLKKELGTPAIIEAKKVELASDDAAASTIKAVEDYKKQSQQQMQQSSDDTVADKIGGGPQFAETMTTAPLIENLSKSMIETKKDDSSPMPVERIQIKQGTNSASYLSQVPHPKVTTTQSTAANQQKFKTQVAGAQYPFNQSYELQKNQSESATGGPLMIKGSQMKKDESNSKEINRVQSMKPIVERLINKNDGDAKTVYWRMNLSGKDDQTVLLRNNKDGVNADLSYYEGSTGAVNLLCNQTQPSGDEPAFQQRNQPQPFTQPVSVLSGPQNNSPLRQQQKRTEIFEEQVNGIGVQGLFSVYGPNSQQNKQRQRPQFTESGGQQAPYASGAANLRSGYPKRSSNTADLVSAKRNTQKPFMMTTELQRQQHYQAGGLDGVEPNSNVAHHMQLVNSIINDGSLHNLVFSNGSLNTEYIQQNKGHVAKLIQQGHSASPNTENIGSGSNNQQHQMLGHAPAVGYDVSDTLVGDVGGEGMEDMTGDEEEDEDEHVIVTMLKSMNSKKLETRQLKDMKLEVDIEKIRNEIKMEFFRTVQQKFDIKVETQWRQRLVKFDRIFNKIIQKKLQLDAENALVRKLEEQARLNEERLKNPFYTTLKAQKEERDKFIDYYQTGMILGLPGIHQQEVVTPVNETEPTTGMLEDDDNKDADVENDAATQQPAGGLDLFQHTRVDIETPSKPKKSTTSIKQSPLKSLASPQKDELVSSTQRSRDDLFCFYKLQVSLPKTFFEKLGNAKMVTSDAIGLIQSFIRKEYPILAKRKRMTFRVSFDVASQVFNTVPLGKDAPLSRCCMRNVNFVFSEQMDQSAGTGNKVYCTDPLCMKSTIDSFQVTEQFIQSLFTRGINRIDLPHASYQHQASQQNVTASGRVLGAGQGYSARSSTPQDFMGQRRRMQDNTSKASAASGLGQRYQSAVSYEISKHISAGNYKHCKLQSVISDTRFKRDFNNRTSMHAGRQEMDNNDLMDMIMNVNPVSTTNHNRANSSLTPFTRDNTSLGGAPADTEIYNENQLLAELIQKKALGTHKHRATLPLNKLMRSVPKAAAKAAAASKNHMAVTGRPPRARVVSHLQQPARHSSTANQMQQYGNMGSVPQRINNTNMGLMDIDDLGDDLVHSLDSSLLQGSNAQQQKQSTDAQITSNLPPKLFEGDQGTRILYQDNASSIQQNASIGGDPDIDDEAFYRGASRANADLIGQEEDGQVMVHTSVKNSITTASKMTSSLQQQQRRPQEDAKLQKIND